MSSVIKFFQQRLTPTDLIAPVLSFAVFLLVMAAPYWVPETRFGEFMRGPFGLIAAVTMYLFCVVVGAIVRRYRSKP